MNGIRRGPAPQDEQQSFPPRGAEKQPAAGLPAPEPGQDLPAPVSVFPVPPGKASSGEKPGRKPWSRRKKLLLSIGGGLLALLLAAGAWLLIRLNRPDARLALGAFKTYRALDAWLHRTEAVGELWDRGWEVLRSGEKHLDAELTLDPGSAEARRLAARLDYDRPGKTLAADLTLSGPGTAAEAALRAEETRAQLSSRALLGEGTYEIPLQDFGAAWNASPLQELTGIRLPAEFSIRLFGGRKTDKNIMEAAFGEKWNTFAASVKIEAYKQTPYFTGKGRTFTVRWDSAPLQAMYRSASRWIAGARESTRLREYLTLDWSDAVPCLLIYGLGRLDAEGAELQFFVNRDGCLSGIRAESPARTLTLSLEGRENLWDRVILELCHREDPENLQTDRFLLTAEASAETLRLNLERTGREEAAWTLRYSGARGRLELLDGAGAPLLQDTELVLLPGEHGASLRVNRQAETGASFAAGLTVSSETPAAPPLDDAARALLSCSEQELKDLLQRAKDFVSAEIRPLFAFGSRKK